MVLRKDKYIWLIIAAALLLYIPLFIFRDFTPTGVVPAKERPGAN